jgi:hypothetical protein
VPIKASAARQIEALVDDLGSDRADAREAAVARLTLVGARAVDRLLRVVDSAAAPAARAAALRALEAIGDPRAIDPVLEAIDAAEVTVAAAAASTARVFLRGPRGAAVVDRLTRAAMDTARDEEARVAALRALADLNRSTIAPLLDALRRDPSEAIQAATRRTAAVDPADTITRAAERGLPDEPAELGAALTRGGARVALPLLLRIIERVREREGAESPAARPEWTRVRGRAHVALADRGSRIALYDLRESIEAASSPLPVEFLAALSTIGDASCLEAVAAAYARATPSRSSKQENDRWWRDHLADAFRLIVTRESLTRRHSVVKKIEKRWGNALEDLWAGKAGGAGS